MRKPIKILLFSFLILLVVSILCIPRISALNSVPLESIGQYPALQERYEQFCADHSDYEIVTEDAIQVISLKCLWGSWERYVLPCYAVKTQDIPQQGSVPFTAKLNILSVWSEESDFSKYCPVKMWNFSISANPGDNMVLPETATLYIHKFGYAMLDPKAIALDEVINCDERPIVTLECEAAANDRTLPAQQTETSFTWSYTLRCWGKEFFTGSFTLPSIHRVGS